MIYLKDSQDLKRIDIDFLVSISSFLQLSYNQWAIKVQYEWSSCIYESWLSKEIKSTSTFLVFKKKRHSNDIILCYNGKQKGSNTCFPH
jgi:hypothetical protein